MSPLLLYMSYIENDESSPHSQTLFTCILSYPPIHIGLSCGLLPLGFPKKISSHLILLDLTTLILVQRFKLRNF